MKNEIVHLVKESITIKLADIAQELFITVSEAREHAEAAIAEKLIKFDEEAKLYYYDFEGRKEFGELNNLSEII